jgi:hypothetical protein
MGTFFTLKLANIFGNLSKQAFKVVNAQGKELNFNELGFSEEQLDKADNFGGGYEGGDEDEDASYDPDEDYEVGEDYGEYEEYTGHAGVDLNFNLPEISEKTMETLYKFKQDDNPLHNKIANQIERFLQIREAFSREKQPNEDSFTQLYLVYRKYEEEYDEKMVELYRSGGRLSNSVITLAESAYTEIFKDVEQIFEGLRLSFNPRTDVVRESPAAKNLDLAAEKMKIDRKIRDVERMYNPDTKKRRYKAIEAWRARNPEKVRLALQTYNKEYFKTNKDKIIAMRAVHRALNPRVETKEQRAKRKALEKDPEHKEKRKLQKPTQRKNHLNAAISAAVKPLLNLKTIETKIKNMIISNDNTTLDSDYLEGFYDKINEAYTTGLTELKKLEPKFVRHGGKYAEIRALYETMFKTAIRYCNIVNRYKFEDDQSNEEKAAIKEKRMSEYATLQNAPVAKPKTRREREADHKMEVLSEAKVNFDTITKIIMKFSGIISGNIKSNLEEVKGLYKQAVDLHEKGLENLLDIKHKFDTKDLKKAYPNVKNDYDNQLEIITNYYNKIINYS